MSPKIVFELVMVPLALWVIYGGGWLAVGAATLWALYEYVDGVATTAPVEDDE